MAFSTAQTPAATPTEIVGAYKPQNYNYSSLPAVPWNQTEAGQKFGQGLNFASSMYGPQQAALQNTGANLAANLASLPGQYGAQAGYLGQANSIQHGLLNQDIIGNQRSQANVQDRMGYNYGSYLNQYQTLAEQAAQQRRSATHDAVARGAYGGAGTGQDFADIAANRNYAMTNAKYDAQTRQANLAQQAIDLETTASKFGLTGAQFDNQLQQGLTKLGIDQTTSVSSLVNMLGSNNYQQAVLASNIIQQALGFLNAS